MLVPHPEKILIKEKKAIEFTEYLFLGNFTSGLLNYYPQSGIYNIFPEKGKELFAGKENVDTWDKAFNYYNPNQIIYLILNYCHIDDTEEMWDKNFITKARLNKKIIDNYSKMYFESDIVGLRVTIFFDILEDVEGYQLSYDFNYNKDELELDESLFILPEYYDEFIKDTQEINDIFV